VTWNALDGFATGKRQERKQEILTPEPIADFAREVFGGQITFDPCPAADLSGFVRPQGWSHGDGLLDPWPNGTFCNPPYKYLKKWLAKALAEAGTGRSSIVLAPSRSHRTWWRGARNKASFVLELNPVTFVGYTAVFPVPMVLFGFNCTRVETKLGEYPPWPASLTS
jgi:hypothetical protein